MESYSITNIKSFKNRTEVQVKPITVFVGKNSCGKSSLMRFPVVLSQTASANSTSALKFYGKLIDYGYYDDVVFNNSKDPIEFSIKYRMDLKFDRNQRQFYGKHDERKADYRFVEIRASLSKIRKKIVIEKNELYIDGILSYGLYRESSGVYRTQIYQVYDIDNSSFSQKECLIHVKNCTSHQFFVAMDTHDVSEAIKNQYLREELSEYENGLKASDGRYLPFDIIMRIPNKTRKGIFANNGIDIPEDESLKEYMSLFDYYQYYSSLMADVHEYYEDESSRLSYIGPFRKNPERIYRDEEFQTGQVGVQGENVTTVLIRDYQKKKGLITNISAWLSKTMGYHLVVDEVSNGLFSLLLEDSNGIRSNIMDVGYGVSQILPIVAQILVDAPKKRGYWEFPVDNMMVVEQPELHLHPAAQSELADLFVSGAIDGKKKLLIETHSEHLIRKLQVLVADPNCALTNNDVAIYYVDKDETGVATVKELTVLPNGKFAEKWPSGFFDKAHELSMELLNVAKHQG